MKIASDLKIELDHLHRVFDRINKTVDRKTRSNFSELHERLNGWAARVAVIGQVKAGKSTFLNAFLRQNDFLPSDVNPWTSVVTNIRINVPGDPISGAKFDFFDEADWQEIIDGGSRIRKLTEQLLPGFDTEVLREQSEMMKVRAQRRLGKHYGTLLGKSHEYDFLTPDLLKRYVCAGPGSDDNLEREPLGRYAALTKVANAYMRMPEFQVPTIVTDTPGVNDPFLVRDEFTCRCLDKSDVFIVALSAHQPLTEVDIALIRILAKQDDKDVVIYVNRIDELDDYNVEVPRVMADIERRLRLAIPDIDFTMVAGSGFMANLAMRTDEEAVVARESLDTIQLAEYLQENFGQVPEDQTDRLLMASGLDNVRRALSEVINNGVGRGQLARLVGDIRAELSANQFVTKQERQFVHTQIESVSEIIAKDAVENVTDEINNISRVHERLESFVETADQQIETVITKSWSKLEAKLINQVQDFVESQQGLIEDRVFRENVVGSINKPLEIELRPIQDKMEVDVREFFGKSRAGTDVALNNCLHACRQLIGDMFDNPTENIDLNDLPFDEFASTVLLAKKSIQVDLIIEKGWKFWSKAKLNVPKTLAAVRAIVAEEMRPPIEKILSAYSEAQVERATAGMSRIRVMLRMLEATLDQHSRRLKQDRIDMEKLVRDPAERAALVHRLQSKIEVLDRRLIDLSALELTLQEPQILNAA